MTTENKSMSEQLKAVIEWCDKAAKCRASLLSRKNNKGAMDGARYFTRRIIQELSAIIADGLAKGHETEIFIHAEKMGWRSEWNCAAMNA